jgi:hypothetical protein
VTEAAIVLPSPPEATPEATATETLPIIPTDATPEITPGAATMEVTVIVTPEVTATESLPELTPEATAPAIVLRVVQGMVRYQNRQGGSDGIQVEVYTEDRATLVSAAQTDGEGRYTVQIPADAPYWLVASAPRYVTQAVLLSADTTPAPLILPGGDLDGDGCVGATDLALLTAQFDTRIAASDIDGDGVVEAADLAILSGNFDAGCRLIPTPPEPTIETTDNPVEATAVLTPTPTSAPPETATIEASVEITTAVTDTPEATPYTGGD